MKAQVIVGENYSFVIPLVLTGALAAIVLAFWLRRYQRGMLNRYLEVEQLTAQRGEQLRQAQMDRAHGEKMRAMGTLAVGIAHDFNNLLSIVRMSGKLISRQAKEDPEIQENVTEIEQAVTQGKIVVRSMLGYSREAVGEAQTFDLMELVEEIVGLLTKEFLGGITLSLELDRDAPAAKCSRGRMAQVLLNLVVNASEAMDGLGDLSIVVRRAGPSGTWIVPPGASECYVELCVSDSGEGIDAEILSRIFEPFFTTKNVGATRGTGLGLSMVYATAQEEGLGLAVQTNPGKGTTFRL